MGFDFNQIKNGITSVGKDIGNKVSDVSAVAKVKLDIHSKEDYMDKQFTELGKAYYRAHRDEDRKKRFFLQLLMRRQRLHA